MSEANAPLDIPQYNATFPQAVRRFWRKWHTFNGRASRSEFWWAALFMTLLWLVPTFMVAQSAHELVEVTVSGGAYVLEPPSNPSAMYSWGTIIGGLLWIVLLVPFFALLSRRLRDINLGGWWALLYFVPVIGHVIALTLAAAPSNPLGVRFDAERDIEEVAEDVRDLE